MAQLKSILFRRDRWLLTALIGSMILALVSTYVLSTRTSNALAADGSITIDSVSLTLLTDADTNSIANIGDTIRIDAVIDNADNATNGNCTTAVPTATVDLTAYGGTATEALAVQTCNNGVDDVWRLDFVIVDAGVSGIDVAADNAASAVTLTASDSDETVDPTLASNNLGDGVVDTTATSGVDTIAPTVSAGNIVIDDSVCSGTPAGMCIIGDTMVFTYDLGADGTADEASVAADLTNFGGSSAQMMFDDGATGGDVTSGDDLYTYTHVVPADNDDGTDEGITVTVTDDAGHETTSATSTDVADVDNIAPVVTAPNFTIDDSACTGNIGECIVGDTITLAWDNSGGGDSNADVTLVGQVEFDASRIGGGAALLATDNTGGIYTVDVVLGEGVIDSGALDADVTVTDDAGNETGPVTSTNAITVDNESPTVTDGSITVTGATGNGGAFIIGDTVLVRWDNGEGADDNTDLDNATADLSEFGGSATEAMTDTGCGGAADDSLEACYTIAGGEAIESIDNNASVTATDDAGNVTTTADGSDFTVDTERPATVSITPNDLVITDADVGVGTFTVTIVYDEAMTSDGSADPTITFSPDVETSGTLTLTGGAWTVGDTTYTATYDVADVNEDVADITITEEGDSEDAAGNNPADPFDELSAFSVQMSNPAVLSIETLDGFDLGTDGDMLSTTADGFLDGLLVVFDRAMDDSTASGSGCDNATAVAGLSINAGAIVGCDTGFGVDDDTLIILLDNTTFATDGTPILTWTGATLSDGTNTVDNNVEDPADDTAPPVMLETETDDVDNDGQIDRLTIFYSELVTVTDGIPGDGFDDITLDGGYVLANGNYAGTNVSSTVLTLTESGGADTDVVVEATYAIDGGTIHRIRDGALNEMGDYDDALESISVTESDGAAPAPIDVNYHDVNGSPDVDGTVSSVTVTFSEALAGTYEDLDWTVPEGGDINMSDDTAGALGEDRLGDPDLTTIRLSVDADEDETSTPLTPPTLTYTRTAGTVNSLTDAAGNPVESFGPVTIDDNAAPFLLSMTYLDDGFDGAVSSDGQIDSVLTVWTEDVEYATCDAGGGDWDFTPNTFTTFNVPAGGCVHTVTDNEIQFGVETNTGQTGSFDSEAEPTVKGDFTGDDLTDTFTDPDTATKNPTLSSSILDFELTDGAGPVVVDSNKYGDTATDDQDSNGLIDTVYLAVTEDVTELDTTDFDVEDGTYGPYAVSAVAYDVGFVELTLTEIEDALEGDTDSTPDTTDLETFEDLLGNASTGNTAASTDGAAPVICTSVDCNDDLATFTDTDDNGNVDQVTLIWSEPVFGDGGEGSFDGSEFDVCNNDKEDCAAGETSDDSGDFAPTRTITIDFTEIGDFLTNPDAGDTGDDWFVDIIGTVDDGIAPGADGNVTPLVDIDLDDDANPVLGAAYTQDLDHNGQIDTIYWDVSEDIEAGSLEISDFSVTDYDIASVEECPGACDDDFGGPNGIKIALDESGTPDTGETPDIEYTTGDTVEDLDSNGSLNAEETTEDRARPVIVDTTPNDGGNLIPRTRNLVATFSELMDTTTIDELGSQFTLSPNPGGVSSSFAVNGFGNTVMTIEHDAWDQNQVVDWGFDSITEAGDLAGNRLCENDGECDSSSTWEITFTAKNVSSGGGGGGGGSAGTTPMLNDLAITEPQDGDTFQAGTELTFDWTVSGSGIDTVELAYSTDGGITYKMIANNLDKDGGYMWTIPSTLSGSVIVKATAQDSGKANLDTDTVLINVTTDTVVEDEPGDELSQDEIDAGVTIDNEGRKIAPMSGTFGSSPFNGQTEEISSVNPGWYIRGYNYSTVYYVTDDGTRRPFWDGTAFMTWADSWGEVIWVSDATLSTLGLDKPMLPQPNAVMVKIQSDPRVYWVEIDSTGAYLLRWVTTEAVATQMFGSAWADYIIDVDAGIFGNYAVGADLTFAETVSLSKLETRAEIASQVAGN